MKLRRWLYISAFAAAAVAAPLEEPMSAQRGDTSPDGKFLIRRFGENIEITEIATRRRYPRISVLPSYIVKWLADSRTILVLQHLAGGSQATLVHFDGRKWRRIETAPADRKYDHIGVVEAAQHDGHLRIVYRADTFEHHMPSHFLITLDVDPVIGVRHRRVQAISFKKYVSLRLLGPP